MKLLRSSIPHEDRKNLKLFYDTSHEYKALLDAHDETYLKDYLTIVLKYSSYGAKILDLGCGNGLSSAIISQSGRWVIGTDISLFFLSGSAHLQHARLRYHVCDVLDLPYKDEKFDVVSSNELIEHVTDAPKALLEMIRVLKKGGILIIMGPNLCSPMWAIMDLARMLIGKKGRQGWSETKKEALKWGVYNLMLSLKKIVSPKVEFLYRLPDISGKFVGGDSDSAYYASSIDIKKFLKANSMKIISSCESVTPIGKIFSNLFPMLSPYISIVAQK